jgi:steroid delta-isomerase-like uncharacterized protein
MLERNLVSARAACESLAVSPTLEAAALTARPTLEAANREVDEHFAPEFVINRAPRGIPADRAGTKQWNAAILNAFPDYQVTVEDQFAADDKVVTRWTAQGTHQGEFQGIPPTGKQVTVTGITISRHADGKIVESWFEWDALDLMEQLGASPSVGKRPPKRR